MSKVLWKNKGITILEYIEEIFRKSGLDLVFEEWVGFPQGEKWAGFREKCLVWGKNRREATKNMAFMTNRDRDCRRQALRLGPHHGGRLWSISFWKGYSACANSELHRRMDLSAFMMVPLFDRAAEKLCYPWFVLVFCDVQSNHHFCLYLVVCFSRGPT